MTALGEAVGKLYVANAISRRAKRRAPRRMVKNLLAAFADASITSSGWRRRQARRPKPSSPRSRSASATRPLAQLRGTQDRAQRCASATPRAPSTSSISATSPKLGQTGRPFRVGHGAAGGERRESAGNERAELPGRHPAAAVLRSRSTAVMDYGATGATIGHEISHSFDDQGALFDASGRLENWWTKEDLAHFEAAAAQLATQFDAYKPFPDLRSTASRRSARTSPTSPACRSPTMPGTCRSRQARARPRAHAAISCSSWLCAELAREGPRGRLRRPSSPMAMRRMNTAPIRCATSTPGTRLQRQAD